MLLAVLSDVHANLEALEAALRLAEARGAEAAVCLGDVVGYGPDPGPCVELVQRACAASVLGNHDAAVGWGRGLDALPPDGRAAAERHRAWLSEDALGWLRARPLRLEAHGATFVHASPDDPAAWNRLDGYHDLRVPFDAFETPICFAGHSHVPAVIGDRPGALRVRPGGRFLVNVGSVGQPRDGDPRLAFALFNTGAFTCEIVRAPYDVERTARKVLAAGLPDWLGERLRMGA